MPRIYRNEIRKVSVVRGVEVVTTFRRPKNMQFSDFWRELEDSHGVSCEAARVALLKGPRFEEVVVAGLAFDHSFRGCNVTVAMVGPDGPLPLRVKKGKGRLEGLLAASVLALVALGQGAFRADQWHQEPLPFDDSPI